MPILTTSLGEFLVGSDAIKGADAKSALNRERAPRAVMIEELEKKAEDEKLRPEDRADAKTSVLESEAPKVEPSPADLDDNELEAMIFGDADEELIGSDTHVDDLENTDDRIGSDNLMDSMASFEGQQLYDAPER